MDCLDAEVAGEQRVADIALDVALNEEGHDVLVDRERLEQHVFCGVRDDDIFAALEQVERVVADHRAEAEIVEIGRREQVLAGYLRLQAITRKLQEVFVGNQRLAAGNVIETGLDRAEEAAVELLLDVGLELPQFVFDDPVVVIAVLAAARCAAAPAERVGQLDQRRVAVVEHLVGEEGTAGSRTEGQRIGCAGAAAGRGARVRFEDQLVAVGAREADVGIDVPAVFAFVLDIETARIELRLAYVIVVVDHGLDAREGAAGDHAVGGFKPGGRKCRARPCQRDFDATLDVGVVEIRIEAIERQHGRGRCLVLHGAVDAEPLEVGRSHERLHAADDLVAIRTISVAPGFEFLGLVGLFGIGDRKRKPDGVAEELVDIGPEDAIADVVRAAVELAEIGIDPACAEGDDLLALFERANGADVDGADEALADEVGGGRFVHIDRAHDFGRVLVELDAAVVVGRRLLAAVEQRAREVGAEATDRNVTGTAGDTLRGQAGKAGDRFTDRGVGELADVLARDRFDDLVLFALFRDRAFQRGAIARDNDYIALIGRLFGVLRPGGRRQTGQGDRTCRQADGCRKLAANCHFNALPKRPGTLCGCLGRIL